MIFRTTGIILFLSAVIMLPSTQLKAQQDIVGGVKGMFEVTPTLGLNSFFGDIGGTRGEGEPFIKDFTGQTASLFGGLSVMYHPSYAFGVKAGINFTSVNAADSLINNEGGQERWRYYRNLSFRSSILEAYIGLEIYPRMIFEKEAELHIVEPFVGVGVGVFNFNPTAELNGQVVELQPLSLEGQGFEEYPDRAKYKLTQIYIPYSVGAKYYINNRFSISSGLQFRRTSTDYIDDISTTYIDPILFDKYLPFEQADLARQLYSRSIRPEKVKPDLEKADAKDNDSYTTFFFSLNIRLGDYFRFKNGYR